MTITFSISTPGSLHIKAGQSVDFDTPLIKSETTESFRVNVSEELGIPNEKIFMYTSKIVGDVVVANEIIAERKTTFGTKKIASPKAGIIKQIDHETGTLVVEAVSEKSNTVLAHFKGTVKELKGMMVTLEVSSSENYSLKDVVADFGGEILYREKQRLTDLSEDNLQNKVVITESIRPAEAVRLDVLGIRGLISKEDIKEKEGVNSAELEDKTLWEDLIKTSHTHCIVDKKNCKLYLYSL